jgi:RNA polymerase sigma-70 factor (ECF subfamily)
MKVLLLGRVEYYKMPNNDVIQMTRSNRTSQPEAAELELKVEQLIGEYYPYIHRLALTILDDLHEADDVAQETFIAAHHSLVGFRNESTPKTWLSSIAINACRGRLRKRKIQQVLSNTLHGLHLLKNPPTSPEQTAIRNEADQTIWKSVDGLDEKHRLPVILRYVHELSVSEIADILRISKGTVHSRLHYARKQLHTQLEHLSPHEEVSDEAS